MTTRKKIDFFIFRFFVSKTTQRERGGRGLFKTGLKMFESAMVVSGERVDLCAEADQSSRMRNQSGRVQNMGGIRVRGILIARAGGTRTRTRIDTGD